MLSFPHMKNTSRIVLWLVEVFWAVNLVPFAFSKHQYLFFRKIISVVLIGNNSVKISSAYLEFSGIRLVTVHKVISVI